MRVLILLADLDSVRDLVRHLVVELAMDAWARREAAAVIVDTAADVREALSLLSIARYEVLIADADLHGVGTLRFALTSERVLLLGWDARELAGEARRLGAHATLVRPAGALAVAGIVSGWLFGGAGAGGEAMVHPGRRTG